MRVEAAPGAVPVGQTAAQVEERYVGRLYGQRPPQSGSKQPKDFDGKVMKYFREARDRHAEIGNEELQIMVYDAYLPSECSPGETKGQYLLGACVWSVPGNGVRRVHVDGAFDERQAYHVILARMMEKEDGLWSKHCVKDAEAEEGVHTASAAKCNPLVENRAQSSAKKDTTNPARSY